MTEEESCEFFWGQVLTGDKADNILGIPGIGPKKAEKILAPFKGKGWEDDERVHEVFHHYKVYVSKKLTDKGVPHDIDTLNQLAARAMDENMKLLWMWTHKANGLKKGSILTADPVVSVPELLKWLNT